MRVCLFCCFTVLLMTACSEAPDDLPETFVPKTQWLASVEGPVLNSSAEVSALWQSKKRCCIDKKQLQANQREFYKACYMAISEHPRNEHLVTKCLWLMDSGMDQDIRYTINRHLYDNYFYFEQPTDNCSSCSKADRIANAAISLASLEASRQNPARAVEFVQRVLRERKAEITPFVQMRLYIDLTRYFMNSNNYSESDVAELEDAYIALRPDSDAYGATVYNYRDFRKVLNKLNDTTISAR